ncbi:MAG TPA: hypothetical protein VNL92_01050 [Dehalococcoidia bacterium]|nr:hypothetical protein [Dehalococcoidia bacterium]
MKNITLSADERLIEEARAKAREEHTTLNEQFRRWLEDYVGRRERAERALATIRELQTRIRLHGPFARDQLNER